VAQRAGGEADGADEREGDLAIAAAGRATGCFDRVRRGGDDEGAAAATTAERGASALAPDHNLELGAGL